MSGASESSVFFANMELRQLNRESAFMRESPIILEVAKAVTIASLHAGVEARVLCTNERDQLIATLMLKGEVGRELGTVWNWKTNECELPNGSADEPTEERR